MTAAERIAAIDTMPAADLCASTDAALSRLLEVMNNETTLLRAGRFRDATPLTAEKAQLAQDYVSLARAVQRENKRLAAEAPEAFGQLRAHHESFATQMAENLRVIATARSVTEDILNDVAKSVGKSAQPITYSAGGKTNGSASVPASGLSIDKAL